MANVFVFLAIVTSVTLWSVIWASSLILDAGAFVIVLYKVVGSVQALSMLWTLFCHWVKKQQWFLFRIFVSGTTLKTAF